MPQRVGKGWDLDRVKTRVRLQGDFHHFRGLDYHDKLTQWDV